MKIGFSQMIASSAACESKNSSKKSFLIWQWFPFDILKNIDVNLNIECPTEFENDHECTGLDDQLKASTILQTTTDDSIVVMRFCTNDDIDAVEYRAQFNETRPLFTEQYFIYQMSLNIDDEMTSVTFTRPFSDVTQKIITSQWTARREVVLNQLRFDHM